MPQELKETMDREVKEIQKKMVSEWEFKKC